MTQYELRFKKSALKDLATIIKNLPRSKQKALKADIISLTKNPKPSSAKKLTGYNHVYRIRFDACRVVYTIEKGKLKIIEVILAAHRKEIYQLLKQIK